LKEAKVLGVRVIGEKTALKLLKAVESRRQVPLDR